MYLDNEDRTLEIILGAPVTTNELDVTVAFEEGTAAAFVPAEQLAITNGVAAVTILSAPERTFRRRVKVLTVRNTDTDTVFVTLQINDDGVIKEIVKVSITVDDTLVYTDTTGFQVIDSEGAIKSEQSGSLTFAETGQRLAGPVRPGTSVGTIYTVPLLTKTTIKHIHIINTTNAVANITLGINGVTDDDVLLKEFDIPKKGTYDLNEALIILGPSETLDALQGTSGALNITVSGSETLDT